MGVRRLAGRLVAALAVLLAVPLVHGCSLHTPSDESTFAQVPPPQERPAAWPVLPREGGEDGYRDRDPLEGLNRVFFYMNGALDWLLFSPLAEVWRAAAPAEVRAAAGRVFANMAEPVVMANHALQLEFERAGVSLGRFALNTTVGLAGLVDVAADAGLEGTDTDFGQTLHRYGIGGGPYLVLPFFGPNATRDAAGFGVDAMLDPRAHLLEPIPRMALGLGEGVVRREQLIDPVDFLTEHAIDHYDAVRAWTWQQRLRELAAGCAAPARVACPDPADP